MSRLFNILLVTLTILVLTTKLSFSWPKNNARTVEEVDVNFYDEALVIKNLIEYDIYYYNSNGELVLNNGNVTFSNINKGDFIPFVIRLKNHDYNESNISIYLDNIRVYYYNYFDIEYIDDCYVLNDTIFNYITFNYVKYSKKYEYETGFCNLCDNITYFHIFENEIQCNVKVCDDIFIEYTDKTNEDIYIYCYLEFSKLLNSNYESLSFQIGNINIVRS